MMHRFKWWRVFKDRLANPLQRIAFGFEGRSAPEVTKPSTKKIKRWGHFLFYTCFAFILALILTLPDPKQSKIPTLQLGEHADGDVVSPKTMEISMTTHGRDQENITKRIAPIFDYDDSIFPTWLENWTIAFATIRKEFYENKNLPKNAPFLQNIQRRLLELTAQNINARDLNFLHQQKFSQSIEKVFLIYAKQLFGRFLTAQELFAAYYGTGISIRYLNPTLTENVLYDLSKVWSLDTARDYLDKVARSFTDVKPEIAQKTILFLKAILVPNLLYNAELTQRRIERALEQKKPELYIVKKGQTLIRRGERVNEVQLAFLSKLKKDTSLNERAKKTLLVFLLLLCVFSALLRLEISRKSFWRLSLKDSLFFGILLMGCLATAKNSLPYLNDWMKNYLYGMSAIYLLPVSTGGVLIHLLMGRELAFLFSLLSAFALGYATDSSLQVGIWVTTVCASSLHHLRSCKQRTDLYRASFWSSLFGTFLVLTLAVTENFPQVPSDGIGLFSLSILTFLSGMSSAVIASSLIPLVEAAFGYTTNLKLLELSNFNHPLLHDLMIKAPGTYHHSIIVGSLAEIAADRIKANALLARVSAYYHDIGKMGKPIYFIENQSAGHNPHDQLAPTMSAKILFSHVKNGIRLGREHNLGDAITGIIEQHHGTTLVSYFLSKAKQTENVQVDPIDENDFRYPGPKPQSREAAIVMIADACEAATRSINDPTQHKIQTMVESIIQKRYLDGQFDECEITLRDLKEIEDCFTKTLVSLYHHRIEYPGQNNEIKLPVNSDKKTIPG